jgi:phosphopantothenoylcysteine decarboxylase/phosphopantothenate--cysteine ligase
LAIELSNTANDLGISGKSLMITAGPTWEALDPVRGITNRSSGMMGYALATAAVEAGARVTLVSGPTHIAKPDRVKVIDVVSALEMHQAVMESVAKQDIFIGVAAVADYRPIDSADQKIKKNDQVMTIEMIKNPDILADVANFENPPFCVGFAAETNDVIEHAKDKLERKKLQLIAANHVGGNETGFATPDNAITLIGPDGVTELPKANKSVLARALIREIAKHFLSSR